MSQFKRKSEQGGFEASESGPTGAGGRPEAGEPDFGALEPSSGFSAGEVTDQVDASPARPAAGSESVSPEGGAGDIFGPISQAPDRPAETPARPAAPARKKRYYSPGEVMQKKGCIGCGGMILAVPLVLAAVGLAIAIL